MGGARPKGVVEEGGMLWVAKFPQRDDRWNNAAVEGAMLGLASRCGIMVPKTRVIAVGPRPVLLVERFDRTPSGAPVSDGTRPFLRHRMVSACTVLNADDHGVDRQRWSYLDLADELQRWSEKPDEDKLELYRRMVFNAMVSNLDDHPRNHALVAQARQWRLSPAFDITPQPMRGQHERDLAMTCGTFGRKARRANLVSAATQFGLSSQQAEDIVALMRKTVAGEWEDEVRARGGTIADIEAIAPAILDEGFDYDMP